MRNFSTWKEGERGNIMNQWPALKKKIISVKWGSPDERKCPRDVKKHHKRANEGAVR